MSVVPVDLTATFKKAGWHYNRTVAVDASVSIDHPAHKVLAELSGIRLMRLYGDYEICEVDFQHLPRNDDLAQRWEAVLGIELVGIAEHHNAHGELYMSAAGHVFGNSIIHPAFWHVGSNFQEAIEHLMEGRPGRPMLLDDETSAMHFGREFTRDDPEVLRPSSPEIR